MKEFQIGPNEAGQRFDKYLRKLLPQAPGSFLYKMMRKKNIVLNGKKAEGSTQLAVGDYIQLYLSDETFDKFSLDKTNGISGENGRVSASPFFPLEVLYENRHILAINKPAGLLSQKAIRKDLSANELAIQYLLDSGSITKQELRTFRPSVCSRLDRNTSGILIVGKTLHGLQEMAQQLKQRTIAKYYICIVCGVLEKEGHLEGFLYKDPSKNKVQVYDSASLVPGQAGSQYIETAYRRVASYRSYTMLEVHLITGRPHQIRAHLASIGHPVVGDPKYGDPACNAYFFQGAGVTRQLLHAWRVCLADGREITAPVPDDFKRAMSLLEAGQPQT